MTLTEGDSIGELESTTQAGETYRYADEKQNLVLYFYPRDNTPGCTQEGQDFRDLHDAFAATDTRIIGVSRDSVASHQKFCDKYEFPFTLLSDPDESLCKHFDVIREKNMYGKKVLGIERSTFLIDKQGVIRHAWRKVRVKEHAQKVLEAAQSL